MSEKFEHIKIKYLDDEITPLVMTGYGDWIDLRCAKDILLMKGSYVEIPLGIAVELPKGYEAIIAPRSSAFKKYGFLVANSIAVIDESYNGDNDEWHLLVYGTRDATIPKDTRIAQFRIIEHQPNLGLYKVETLGNPDRGGIGSSGEK